MTDSEEDDGARVPGNKLERILKLGTMSGRVAVSSLASTIRSHLPYGDPELREERLREALEANAESIAEVLGELKGASMKLGQLLSTDPEMLPDGFSEVLASLQRDAPPMPYATVVDQIEESTGREIETIFEYFDPEPIGAASIGQVHRGRLDDGTAVAVKVQFPGVVDALESDLRTLRQLLVFGRIAVDRERLDDYFEEIRETILREADYVAEARQMDRFADVLDERAGIDSPRPFPKWSSRRVLVMELVEGEKLDEALLERDPSDRRRLLRRWIETHLWLVHERQVLHGDPHPGNFLLDDDVIHVLDFGCVAEFDASFTDGLLELLVACWNGDEPRAMERYDELGFSTEEKPVTELDPELLRQYHELILAPLLVDEPFDFGDWNPTLPAKKFVLRHPSFFALVPPKQALLYYRVLAGIKGLLRKLDVTLNVRELVEDAARRRGVLAG